MTISAQDKVKWLILAMLSRHKGVEAPPYPAPDIAKLYEQTEYVDEGGLIDAINETRASGTNTGLPCEWSRNYDSSAVAAQLPDKTWVGWTYWFGGGKHGCPRELDWISGAYDVTCKEEEKLVTVREFSKPEVASVDG